MTNNPLVEALRKKIAAARKTADDIRYYSGGSQRNHHAEELAEYLMNCVGDDLLAALASSAPATGELERELERGLTRIARSNLRHYLNAAQFKCEVDRTAALNCLDVLEEEIDGLSDLVAVLRSYHAAEDRLAALSSAPATGEREQIVAWLRALAMADLTPGIVAFFGDPWGDDGQRLLGEVAEAIARGDHRTQSGEMEGGEHG